MVDGIDIAISSLRDELNSLKQRISQCRRKGLDTKIAELMLMSVPAKIIMIGTTRDIKDVQKLTGILAKAKSEVEELEGQIQNGGGQKESL